MQTNKEILLEVEKLLQSLNMEESQHEAAIILASTISDQPGAVGLYDAMLSVYGKQTDLGHLQFVFLKNKPEDALFPMKTALVRLAKDKGISSYLEPLIESVFLALGSPGKKRSPIIIPKNGRFNEA